MHYRSMKLLSAACLWASLAACTGDKGADAAVPGIALDNLLSRVPAAGRGKESP